MVKIYTPRSRLGRLKFQCTCLRSHSCPSSTIQGPGPDGDHPARPGCGQPRGPPAPGNRAPGSGRPRGPGAEASGAPDAYDSGEGSRRGCGLWHLKTTEKSRCISDAAEATAAASRRPVPFPSERAGRPRRPSGRSLSAAGNVEEQPKPPRRRGKSPEQSAAVFPSLLSYKSPGSFGRILRENGKREKAWRCYKSLTFSVEGDPLGSIP